ncbi:hypothetical protein L195_g048657 [Trifolium pratense]|uniref:AtPDCT1/2 transmembrane domain-containing protein n=1 Tax=Trifolium pratense TaxID=57577 RepID=A0A2K3JLX0_TRIPR|nr:hypothetical protein L195_g048657 [Trifolium pratense]
MVVTSLNLLSCGRLEGLRIAQAMFGLVHHYCLALVALVGFLCSGVDFPVGNVSFFLFFSGHVAGLVIASLDMRRMKRWEMAWTFDVLNVLQAIRLLGTRGHYTIDLAVGLGAGYLFDSLAGKYVEDSKRKIAKNSVNGHVSKHDLVT